MKLLVVNFEMDDRSPVLAWQARVVRELAALARRVVVLTERVGVVDVPSNVEIIPFPRFMVGPPRKLGSGWLANALATRWTTREHFDAAFVHMAHEWSYRLAPWFRVHRIPVLVWYAHGATSWRLRLTERLASGLVTSTPEGFRLHSDKLSVIGQGIDTDLFGPRARTESSTAVYVGRISPRKSVDLLVEAMAILRDRHAAPPIRLRIIGPANGATDRSYRDLLEDRVRTLDLQAVVELRGSMSPPELARVYDDAFLHVNVSATGSMDKAVLEALSTGCPVLTSNEAFVGLLAGHPEMMLDDRDPATLADRIEAMYERRLMVDHAVMRGLVVGVHDIHTYAHRVLDLLRQLADRS